MTGHGWPVLQVDVRKPVYCPVVGTQVKRKKLGFQVRVGDGVHRFMFSSMGPLKIRIKSQKSCMYCTLSTMKSMRDVNTFWKMEKGGRTVAGKVGAIAKENTPMPAGAGPRTWGVADGSPWGL